MKSFNDLLKEAIDQSGLTLDQIAEGCKKRGLDIHYTHLSKMRTGKRQAPPDEHTIRIIAEVIGADVNRLIFSGYLDRAPQVVRELLGVLDENIIGAAIAVHNGDISRDAFRNILKENLTVSETIQEHKPSKALKDLLLGEDPETESDVVRLTIEGTVSTTPVERVRPDFEGIDYVSKNIMQGRNGFILKIQGDGMINNGIYDGDRVVIAITNEVGPNDIAYIKAEDSTISLAKVKNQNNMNIIIPVNGNMEVVLVPQNKVTVVGKVVEVRRNLK